MADEGSTEMTDSAPTASRSLIPKQFDEMVGKINLSQTSTARFNPIKNLLAPILGVDPDTIYATAAVSRTNNLSVRWTQTHGAFSLGLGFIGDKKDIEYAAEIAASVLMSRTKYQALAVCVEVDGVWTIAAVVEYEGGKITDHLSEVFPGLISSRVPIIPSSHGGIGSKTVPFGIAASTPSVAIPILVEPRIKRMIRVAISSYRAVVLVGPPGTGKTELLEEIHKEAVQNPGSFGLTKAPGALKTRTPEESWTTRDLVGGETIDEQNRLRFRPGIVLDAIREDRWLLLDELNRADMDKIFGPLMTWLSGKPVELGRVDSSVISPAVELHWIDEPACKVEGAERLSNDDTSVGLIKYSAGNEWRLLGTYNPLDAHRVFRFGQALARRLVEIPIPIPTPAEFQAILATRSEGLPQEVSDRLNALYKVHYNHDELKLGPAAFLDTLTYIRNGLVGGQLIELDDTSSEPPDEGVGTDATDDDNEAPTGQHTVYPEMNAVTTQLVAEAYLASTGKYLAKLNKKQLANLGNSVVTEHGLPQEEWDWVKKFTAGLC